MTLILKTPVILESPKDWEVWYEIVRSSAQARGILSLIDVNVAFFRQLIRPVESNYIDVKPGAQSYAGLNADQKDHYKILVAEYWMWVKMYKRQKKALLAILDLIQSMISRNLWSYIHGLNTSHLILKALKKWLALTDLQWWIKLLRELQTLKKALRGQILNKWLLQ